MTMEAIKRRLAGFDEVHFYGPILPEDIYSAERDLGIAFSPEYRQFLGAYGCGSIESEEFIGLGGPEHLDIVKLKQRLSVRRSALPSHLLPIRMDGAGNYDCFDVRNPAKNAEFPIVEWTHDGGAVQECRVLASSFFEWLESMFSLIEEAR